MSGVYRFTYTGKWEDRWFYELDNSEKVFWLWVCDHADIGGFLDFPGIAQIQGVLRCSNEEAIKVFDSIKKPCLISKEDGTPKLLWIRNFVKHQKNYPIYVKKGAHRSIVKKYVAMKEVFWFDEGFKEFYIKFIEPCLKQMEAYYEMLKEKREGKVATTAASGKDF